MSTYDSYEVADEPRRHKSHRHHHRDRDEPRYQEVRETYVSAPLAPEPPYLSSQRTELIRRPGREDSDQSVEEVQRQFPPPGGAYVQSRTMVKDDRYRGVVRSRSADRGSQYGTYLGDPRDDRSGRRKSIVKEKVEDRHRSLSRNEKILAGVAGAALAVGGKEIWDRREAAAHPGSPKERNFLGTAAIGAAGAFAGYEATELYSKQVGKRDGKKEKDYVAVQDKHGNVAEAYYSDSGSDKPKKSSRRKSIIEGALGLAGIGAAAKAGSGGRDKGRSRRGSSSDSFTSKRSRGGKGSRGGESEGLAKIQQAAKAALLAGAAEAFRVRNEPGGWGGAKGKRILTAAIGAGGIDAAADRDPDRHSKRHVLEAVVGGLAGNRIVNGSRKNVDDDGRSIRGGRSRSRSRAPSSGGGGAGLAALATAGLGALAGKKLLDRSRSRSRAGDDRRRRDSSSEDDRGERRHRRSKSVSDFARKGLAALGIGEAAEATRDKDDRRGTREVEETHVIRKSRHRGSSDDDYDEPRRSSGQKSRGVYDDDRYAESRSSVGGDRRRRKDRDDDGDRSRRVAEGKQATSDTDSLGSSTGDERRVKKMKGKQFLTTGLAAVATIHAAHNVYQSVEKRNARHKAVQDGEMSKEEAKKLKTKARLQDAASIGIAALGIKGAYSEWKEMSELRHEYHELEEKKEERHLRRLERQKGSKAKAGDSVGGKRRRSSDLRRASAPDLSYGDTRDPRGPTYVDSNPYAPGLPAPPIGYTYAERR